MDISAGGRHSFFLTEDQTLFCCGDANHGQLGLDLKALKNFDRVCTPTELTVFKGKNIMAVACGKYHTLFLVDGIVYACGHNREGQIGNGNTENAYKPVKLGLNNCISVSAWHSSAALTESGEVFIWGVPNFKKPHKISTQQFNEVKVGGNFTLFTDAEGRIMTSTNGSQPHYVSGLEENFASELCVGGNFAFVIGKTTNGTEEESPAKEYEAVDSGRSQEAYEEADHQPEAEEE